MSTSKANTLSSAATGLVNFLQICLAALICWYFFKPEGLTQQGWNLLIIFVGTIVSIVAKILPMGGLALVSISFIAITKTLPLSTVLEAFSYDQIWLIVFACFLARGFIKTGLGARIAYGFVSFFGGTPYGMSYGLLVSSACMAPLIPSTTARTGGILLPVLRSIIEVLGGKSAVSAFLTMVVLHGSVITSAMFITANASNPIIVKFAQNMGIEISWMQWAKAAIIPGCLSLMLLPVVLHYLLPCQVPDAERVRSHAKEELAKMGSISWQEKMLLSVFSLLLMLWAFGSFFGVHATEAALVGVSLLLVTQILSWKDILQEDLAWDTFIWMGILIMMASELQNHGVINWFTERVVTYIPSTSWPWQLALLSILYFYTHYFFASITAHVSSMYGPFLAIACASGAPPVMSALFFGFLSSLFGALTHYSSGPAPILYAQNQIELKTWWKVGFVTSLFYLVVWGLIGSLWWRVLDIF
jgi:DASS family divalent anion:Na+ symporter